MGSVSCFVMLLADLLMKSNSKTYELGKLSFRGASQRYLVTSCHMLSCYEYALYLLGPLNLAPLCKPGHATEEAEGSAFFFDSYMCWKKCEIICTPEI